MQFIVARISLCKSIEYATDRFADGSRSFQKSEAIRFRTLHEAIAFSVMFDRSDQQAFVIALSEPTTFPSLSDAHDAIVELRTDLLFESSEGTNSLTRYATQHFLQSLSQLESSAISMNLAWMEQLENR